MLSGELIISGCKFNTAPRVADKFDTMIVMYSLLYDIQIWHDSLRRDIKINLGQVGDYQYRFKIKYNDDKITSMLFIKIAPINTYKNDCLTATEPNEMMKLLDIMDRELRGEMILDVR